ncbi:hypothetical protein [Streptomyces lasiicapitis]|uniref:hypothetical protein n=1 Tax=Streptomyces lasiicapitis TaxID=1923961 RepID=UPI0036C168D3
MHDHPTDLADYEWPVCAALRCQRQLWVAEAGRLACRPCEDATLARIRELPALFVRLNATAMLMKGARRTDTATSGSRTPPIPPRLDVLALVGPGGIAARLRDIEDAWRKALGWTIAPWRGSPAEAIPQHAKFLDGNLLWACGDYESIGQDIETLRELHGECKAIAEEKQRFGNVKIGRCPISIEGAPCGEQLYASGRSFKTVCPACRTAWEGEDEWRELRAAQEAVVEEQFQQTGAAA